MARGSSTDEDQFCDFVAARSGALFRVAYLLVGERHLAQDLVQEALVKTYVAWPRLRDVANAEAYTRRVMATTVISWRRRRGFHERPSTRVGDHAGQVQVHDDVATLVARDALWRELMSLPPRQRTAIVLRYYVDLSEAHTAEAMGCSVGTVKSSASAGLHRLRERIGPELVPLPRDEAVAP